MNYKQFARTNPEILPTDAGYTEYLAAKFKNIVDYMNTKHLTRDAKFSFEGDNVNILENIAAMIKLGAPVRDYDGKVFCFIEAGKDRATYAMFDYLNPPDPRPPTKAVHWFKTAYNKLYWISARGLL